MGAGIFHFLRRKLKWPAKVTEKRVRRKSPKIVKHLWIVHKQRKQKRVLYIPKKKFVMKTMQIKQNTVNSTKS